MEHNKLKNLMFGTPACLYILTAGLKPPRQSYLHKRFQNPSALAHCLLPGHLLSHPSSDFPRTFRSCHSYPRLLRCWKVTICRLVWDVTLITHVLACPAGRVTLSPTPVRSWVNPALDGAQDQAPEEGTADATSA